MVDGSNTVAGSRNAPEISARSVNLWVMILVLSIGFCCCLIDRLAWSNILTTYASASNLSPTAVGSFYSAFFFGYLISTTAAGILADYFGGKRVIGFSFLALGILTGCFGLTSGYVSGLMVQIAMGLAAGADYSPAIKIISGWVRDSERGTAIGLFLCATPISLILSNAIVPTLLNSVGWRGVYFILGAMTVAAGVLVMMFVSDPPSTKLQDQPAKAKLRISDLLRNRGVVIAAFCGFSLLWAGFGFAFWSNALLVEAKHFSPVQAGFLIAFYGVSGLVGKPAAGWIADRVNASKLTLAVLPSAIFCIGLLVFSHLESATAFVICISIMGLCCWGAAVLVAAAVVEAAGPAMAGSAAGTANSLWSLGYILVPLIVGAIFQMFGSINFALAALAAGPGICAILAFIGRNSLSPKHV